MTITVANNVINHYPSACKENPLFSRNVLAAEANINWAEFLYYNF